jgi:glutaminyl-tRNA synthetase
MYDYAHGQSDAIEGITHSICTLEFEDHKPLYEWFLQNLPVPAAPKQYEFARLNLTYTVMSKRKLLQLVQDGDVAGWDDPRMPTLVGLRRRGYTPEAIRTFCERIGVGRSDSWIDMSILEDCVREDLNDSARRVMAVLQPLRLVLDNYPAGEGETLEIPYHPQKPELGSRHVPFCGELFIEADDFQEIPEKGFKRLTIGGEVRLRNAYIIRCDSVEKDGEGKVTALHCSYDPETKSGMAGSERKVKGVIHWVSAQHALSVPVRLYDRLISVASPAGDDWKGDLNPDSVQLLADARLEPSLATARAEERFQFERLGYFTVDLKDSLPGKPVFNRTVTLRDSWAKR